LEIIKAFCHSVDNNITFFGTVAFMYFSTHNSEANMFACFCSTLIQEDFYLFKILNEDTANRMLSGMQAPVHSEPSSTRQKLKNNSGDSKMCPVGVSASHHILT